MEAADYIERYNYGARVESVEGLVALIKDVITGRRKFAQRTESDLERSATATIGRYILERLKDA